MAREHAPPQRMTLVTIAISHVLFARRRHVTAACAGDSRHLSMAARREGYRYFTGKGRRGPESASRGTRPPERDQPGTTGKIISERWATSSRNPGRLHSGFTPEPSFIGSICPSAEEDGNGLCETGAIRPLMYRCSSSVSAAEYAL